ncbi:hypothetical protein BJX96DRAFT_159293 [Aspergillus floccosus]
MIPHLPSVFCVSPSTRSLRSNILAQNPSGITRNMTGRNNGGLQPQINNPSSAKGTSLGASSTSLIVGPACSLRTTPTSECALIDPHPWIQQSIRTRTCSNRPRLTYLVSDSSAREQIADGTAPLPPHPLPRLSLSVNDPCVRLQMQLGVYESQSRLAPPSKPD